MKDIKAQDVNHKASFKERSDKLRGLFLRQLPSRITTAQQLCDYLQDNQGLSPESIKANITALHRIFHNIKGTGASFGYSVIADLASQGEQLCQLVQAAVQAQGQTGIGQLFSEQLPRLRALVKRMAEPGADQIQPHTLGLDLTRWSQQAAAGAHTAVKHIYLCDDDPLQLRHVAEQLACFGHEVSCFEHTSDLIAAMQQQPPSVLIMDVVFPEGDMAGIEAVNEAKRQLRKQIPTVFISGRDTFEARLEAVRAGGMGYCIKPVSIMDLVEFVDKISGVHQPERYRILVVDDDQSLADYHALVLEQAGMQVQVETDPTQVLDVLTRFYPDLVLMDLYMPKCAGPELAKVLRQIPGYLGLPIVYLSSETEEAHQFAALEVGADGFLTKPIEPDTLIVEVSLRAERMRILRQLMMRDSLTGLYNHSNTKRILEQELASAQRRGTHLVLAMLDIDHFKQVNDVFGHAMGDQVLTAMARLLRQRLRQSDFIGRYGGEEFAVILPDTSEAAAVQLLDGLRIGFASLRFLGKSAEFNVTFSCGIASSANFPVFSDLRMEADLALYKAKNAGRNRIEVAIPKQTPRA